MTDNSNRQVRFSVIDNVLSTQPELGPKIPDGGYGWVVFGATLFFQMFIPSLIVVYGVFLAAAKMYSDYDKKEVLYLCTDKLIYVPLVFTMSWTIFDPTSRNLISHSTWPRLIGQAGNSLTCAGFLFIWIGLAGNENGFISDKVWFMLAGLASGIGASIQVSQCEILLAQYFKLKHLYLTHITHIVVATGFIISPILVSHLRMKFDLFQVVLIYQVILLQGLLISITFKKPEYLKTKLIRYHYVMENGDEEEDIFSKSSTELKLKTEDMVRRIQLKRSNVENQPSTSTDANNSESYESVEEKRKNWIDFNEENASEAKNEQKIKGIEDQNNNKNETEEKYTTLNGSDFCPMPLFNEMGVNMNTTYAFDDNSLESSGPRSIPSVFSDTDEKTPIFNLALYMKIIRTPTFYKSLLTVITTKYSVFLFYTLFPSYFYIEVSEMRLKKIGILVGTISLGALIFSGVSYWLNVTKQKRPIFLFILCWVGANGYFLLAAFRQNEYFVIFGAIEIVLSIASLQHIGGPLLGLTIRGESNPEYAALCVLTGLSFTIFFVIDISYKTCFMMMALLHVVTGLVWVSNFFYKKLRLYYV